MNKYLPVFILFFIGVLIFLLIRSYSSYRCKVVEGYCCAMSDDNICNNIYDGDLSCSNNKKGVPNANVKSCYINCGATAILKGETVCEMDVQLKKYCGGKPPENSRDGPMLPCEKKCDCKKLNRIGEGVCDWNQGVNVNPTNTPYGCDSNNCPSPEWCDASACFPPGGPKSINFENKTSETLYYIFTFNTETWGDEKKQWTFSDESIPDSELISTDNQINTKPENTINPIFNNGTIEVYRISSNHRLSIKPVDITVESFFTSGNVKVLGTPPNNENWDFTQSTNGLTALEFTVNPYGSFTPDISMLEGINISVDMKMNGETREAKINDINNLKNTYNKYYKKIPYPRISMLEWDKNTMDRYRGDSNCGIDGNCITCATGEDECKGVNDCVNKPEQWDEINKRFGCYKWWANPDNKFSQDWLKIFNELNLSTYKWVYDETMLKINPSDKNISGLQIEPGNRDKWRNSQAYKCYIEEGGNDDPKCFNHIVKNPIQPSIMGYIGRDVILTYTIYEVLN